MKMTLLERLSEDEGWVRRDIPEVVMLYPHGDGPTFSARRSRNFHASDSGMIVDFFIPPSSSHPFPQRLSRLL